MQLAGFAGITVMLDEDRRTPAILQALACHCHKKLQGHLYKHLALAHLLLDRLR